LDVGERLAAPSTCPRREGASWFQTSRRVVMDIKRYASRATEEMLRVSTQKEQRHKRKRREVSGTLAWSIDRLGYRFIVSITNHQRVIRV
jgi:hypothetical protein